MYLTLSSDSSKTFFSDNTIACFTTQLTRPICPPTQEKHTQFEVGVVEVFLPPMIANPAHSNIYLYSDISQPVLVADTAARLLRVISPLSVTGYHEFKSVHYAPVEKNNFSTVSLSFHTKDGTLFPFPDGEDASIVVLHFREISA